MLSQAVITALEPYVGVMAADTCVRATALAVGKTADELGPEDVPQLCANVRKLLAPIAPAHAVEGILGQIRGL